MKSCCTTIALCLLIAACDVTRRSPTGPLPDPDVPAGSYALDGYISDGNGETLAGVSVSLATDKATRTAVTDANGFYRFDDVSGRVTIDAKKEDYVGASAVFLMTRDRTLNLTLARILILTAGTTIRSTTRLPPCDPSWDARAPCESIRFMPTVTGSYEFVLTWDGSKSELDLLVPNSRSLYWVVTSDPNQIRGAFPGTAGVEQEFHVHSYYDPAAFELTVRQIS